ncbi:glycyl-tRNA synthetase beta chain [Candidatus Kinetoplastibacterium crithidii TCC036E]|uniref:Glycine--tRNA ligase beta subunit n=2 Tax=Candidatus Kinetoplastidibacterium crithidiae TaxID=33056 RepID=M1M6Y6_9PROT|nr:glycyl-tRNA synthetase beta chain [Candidatus Kinetoplastibacterium crithidii TCC036E]
MRTKALTIELLTEELPPKKLLEIENTFTNSISLNLSNNNVIGVNNITNCYSTPRRLAISFSDVLEKSPDVTKKEKLMPKKIGLTENNQPTQALIKKLYSKGLDEKHLSSVKIELNEQQEYLTIENSISGKTIQNIVQETITTTIQNISNQYQSMRYQLPDEVNTVKFIRPARNLLVLFGKELLDISVLGIKSSNETIGHRFMSNSFIKIDHANKYEDILETKGFVIPSFIKRKKYILNELKEKATQINSILGNHEELMSLLDEVTATVEYPSVYIGEFDKEFLELPRECLILTMRSHQKYFPLFEKETNNLINKFLIVSNVYSGKEENIITGNQKVIYPRLSDAKFFYETDNIVSLDKRVLKLKNVIYHNKIGNQLERVERLRIISKYLANKLATDPILADRAAMLSKSDLESLMVGEFPELQGIMGSYYAKQNGESDSIVDALKNQYINRFDQPVTSKNIISAILFLSERIEKVISLFSIKIYPSGEKDPYGLRRAAIGIINIFEKMVEGKTLETNYSNYIDILELSELTLSLFHQKNIDLETPKKAVDFIHDRYKYQLLNNFNRDIIESTFAKKPPLHLILPILKTLEIFKTTPKLSLFLITNKRINNFLKQDNLSTNYFEEKLIDNDAEKILYDAFLNTKHVLLELLQLGKFSEYLELTYSLIYKTDNFLNKVTIMTTDNRICNNRLFLLSKIREIINNFADLSYLNHENNNI